MVYIAIGGNARRGRAAVMGQVCPRPAISIGRSLGCVLQGCKDAVEGGLESDHLGLHDLGVRRIRT